MSDVEDSPPASEPPASEQEETADADTTTTPARPEKAEEALKANVKVRRRGFRGIRGRMSVGRAQQRELENNAIIEGLSSWLTKLTKVDVENETFVDDLASGVALCRLVRPLGYCEKFNDLPSNGKELNVFKRRENFVKFQKACVEMNNPCIPTVGSLDKNNLIPCLLHIAGQAMKLGNEEMMAAMNSLITSKASKQSEGPSEEERAALAAAEKSRKEEEARRLDVPVLFLDGNVENSLVHVFPPKQIENVMFPQAFDSWMVTIYLAEKGLVGSSLDIVNVDLVVRDGLEEHIKAMEAYPMRINGGFGIISFIENEKRSDQPALLHLPDVKERSECFKLMCRMAVDGRTTQAFSSVMKSKHGAPKTDFHGHSIPAADCSKCGKKIDRMKAEIEDFERLLNDGRSYLAGESFSLADVVAFPWFALAIDALGLNRERHKRIVTWYKKCCNREAISNQPFWPSFHSLYRDDKKIKVLA